MNPQKKYHRVGYAFYSPEIDIQAAFDQLDRSKVARGRAAECRRPPG